MTVPSALVLLSGGLDSSTLLHQVRAMNPDAALHAISFAYGQKHSRELEMADHQAMRARVSKHQRVDIGFLGQLLGPSSALTSPDVSVPDLSAIPASELAQPPTYVPNRNMTLLSIAVAYAEANGVQHVYYGAQAQDRYGYWDCTIDFVTQINHLLSLNRKDPVTVHAPFVHLSKTEVLKIGLGLGVDYRFTWTCYRGNSSPCRTCPSCVERHNAFLALNRIDPLLS
jgi:7-cyano-7-deazaguanine synthase